MTVFKSTRALALITVAMLAPLPALAMPLTELTAEAVVAQAPAQTESRARLIAIEGSNNFRDIGGYPAMNGQTVKWGVLYRSAEMSHITPKGFDQLRALGIKVNIDFRSKEEREKEPNAWPADMGVVMHTVDYSLDLGAFRGLFANGTPTADSARQVMTGFYTQVPFQFAPQYKTLMREVINGRTPLVYNCSAGKDRTGMATALVLRLLGVPYETIKADYLLSNQYYTPRPPKPGAPEDPAMAFFRTLPADVVAVLMGVEGGYLDAAMAAIDTREGSWDRYVREDLGLTDADIAAFRAKMLTQ